MLRWPAKDPDANLPHDIDWSAYLAGSSVVDTIIKADWIIPTGLTKTNETLNGGTTTVWLSGGTHGQNYLITCRVTLDSGATDDRSVMLPVRNR